MADEPIEVTEAMVEAGIERLCNALEGNRLDSPFKESPAEIVESVFRAMLAAGPKRLTFDEWRTEFSEFVAKQSSGAGEQKRSLRPA